MTHSDPDESRQLMEVISVPDTPHEFVGHPAKLHRHIAETLIRDYSRPGGVVLDPFAGLGTVPRAAVRLGRVGLGIEIEQAFVDRAADLGVGLFHADTRDIAQLNLPPIDLIVTSPPYGEAIGRAGDRDPAKTAKAKATYEIRRFGKQITKHAVYGCTPGNIGALPLRRKAAPSFTSELPGIVSALIAELTTGGRLVWVVKDQRLGRRRLGACDIFSLVRQVSEECGLIYEGRRVAVLPDRLITQWQRVNAQRWGIPVPNAEHVCVMRKP